MGVTNYLLTGMILQVYFEGLDPSEWKVKISVNRSVLQGGVKKKQL